MKRPTLPDLPIFCEGPFKFCPLTLKIFGVSEYGDACHVADTRGWGYLTGGGAALALDHNTAIEAQRKTAQFIVDAMNVAWDALQRKAGE